MKEFRKLPAKGRIYIMKRFTKTEWTAMKIVAPATATTAVVREDENGARWQWKNSGKRVEATRVA